MRIINPANDELIREIQEDDKNSILEKYKLAKEGQKTWMLKSLDDRIKIIKVFSDLLEANKKELATTLTIEMGKPLSQSFNEINGARNRIQFFIDNSKKYLSEEWMVTEGGTKEKITFEPLGVIANISAWNYPYLVGVNVFIPALLAGNSVLYKPSEYTTLTGLHIQRLLTEAGVPHSCFQVVVGGKQAGQMILDLEVDGYFFTGSYKTGQFIAQQVAPRMVPFQLELGGKDPLYVMDDVADVSQVAAAAVEGVFYNNGQSCCAVERIYVQEKIYDKFLEVFLLELKKMKVGDPMKEGTDIGPLSRKEQLSFLSAQVKDAVDKGAKVLTGGKEIKGQGNYFEPTVLSEVNHTMKVMKEETFGPLVGIQKVKNDEEAFLLMQDTEFGLTSAVYSKSKERAEKILDKMNTGSVYWNCCDRVSPYLPWSGRKNSGMGSTLSYIGIRAFVKPKGHHLRG
jgi:acyl-CoA reductase-like NAD-dependent aldehyde dehydrogenase